mgnify:CR=1 FL=1
MSFDCLGVPSPYAEEDVIELRWYHDKDWHDSKVTWFRSLFHRLLDSPRCPKLNKDQLLSLICQREDHDYHTKRLLTLLRLFDKKSPLIFFLTIPFEPQPDVSSYE